MLSGKPYKADVAKLYLPSTNKPNVHGTPEAFRRILRPLSQVEEDYNSDDDLTKFLNNIKKDFHIMNTFLQEQYRQRDINKNMMDGFSESHKISLIKARTELQLDNYDSCPDLKQALSICNSAPKKCPPTPPALKKKKEEALKCYNFLKLDYDSVDSSEGSEMSYNYMSGFWRILENEYNDKGFKITQKLYNAYEQAEPNMLENPEVDSWIVEQSTRKCTEWLRNQCTI